MSGADADLRVELEFGPPAALPAGVATAAFLLGSCFHRHRRVRGLRVLVDGIPTDTTAFGMPRIDLFRALHPKLPIEGESVPESDPSSDEDPEVRSYRSGFWATVVVAPDGEPGSTVALALLAELDDGSEARIELAGITIERPPLASGDPTAGLGSQAGITICMSTFNPDMRLFQRQIDSIRAQSTSDWVCVVSDDCSSPETYRQIEATLAGDERFRLSRSPRRLGFYRGFERALTLAPPGARLVALCDQDDVWYPDKLATLEAELGDAMMVYSDQRLVDRDGKVQAESYWTSRRNNHTDLTSLLIANTVTGAASLMRAEVVEGALPFPDVPGEQYHDHWLALVAMALGRVAYVDRPLYDYVQHGGAVLGHAAANPGTRRGGPGLGVRLRGLASAGRLRSAFADARRLYFDGYVRLEVLAETLLARLGERVEASKRRGLRRFIRAQRRPLALAWLALRPLRARLGRDETLGAERILVKGILWRWLVVLESFRQQRPRGRGNDAGLLRSSVRPSLTVHGHKETARIQQMIAPLELSVSEREPERVNVLIPTIELRHFFGGYIAKFNLARRLAERGHRVRLVCVDPRPPLPGDWREQVEGYSGLAGLFSKLEVAFARDQDAPLPVNPGDRFVATTWWTAYHARDAVRQTNSERFVYLIQEYEPFTFSMSSWAALAMETYRFPHFALFSTPFLRDFFAAYKHGVFAAGAEQGERDSVVFFNAITQVERPSIETLAQRPSRRLLFYARAEAHAQRNMFELALLSLCEAIERGTFGPEWEFHGIGSVGGSRHLALPRGAHLDILNRTGQDEYGELLGRHDVGLSLMMTPHPSLPPIEMASAGLLTVTNSYDTKTAELLSTISGNLIVAQPTIEGVVSGLAEAVSRVPETEARIREAAAVSWPSDWERSFDDQVIAGVDEMLARCVP